MIEADGPHRSVCSNSISSVAQRDSVNDFARVVRKDASEQ